MKMGKCPNCKGDVILEDSEHKGPCCDDCVEEYEPEGGDWSFGSNATKKIPEDAVINAYVDDELVGRFEGGKFIEDEDSTSEEKNDAS